MRGQVGPRRTALPHGPAAWPVPAHLQVGAREVGGGALAVGAAAHLRQAKVLNDPLHRQANLGSNLIVAGGLVAAGLRDLGCGAGRALSLSSAWRWPDRRGSSRAAGAGPPTASKRQRRRRQQQQRQQQQGPTCSIMVLMARLMRYRISHTWEGSRTSRDWSAGQRAAPGMRMVATGRGFQAGAGLAAEPAKD